MRHIERMILAIGVSAAFLGAQTDPPGRAGRLNYINGPVSFQPAGVTDWVDATINRPLTTGDHLWVGEGGQAEIHAGSTALRLDSNTAFQFLNLDDQTAQIQLSQGTLTARVRNFGQGQNFEIDTPSMAFTMLRPGEYRVGADPNAQTSTITVRAGDGEVTGGGQTFPVHAGQQAIVSGGDQITYDVEPAPGPDAWDQWSNSRDGREDRSPSARYVSREVPGYDDLDQNGRWQSEPGYGQVWRPSRVAADWAPYHGGQWVWVAPWGWTWVDDQPWGYAPSHYGRWASFNDGWGWVPGPLNVSPCYSPALVGWVGGGRGGAGFSVGFSFGSAAAVGWFPLGPRDPYIPGYETSRSYFNRVNNTNTTINNTTINNYYDNSRNSNNTITNIKYVNQNVRNAVIAVPQNTFANGRPVAQTARPVPAAQLATARFAAAPAIAPQQASVLGPRAGTAPSAPRPPASAFSRPVVARTAPPPPPVAFARQQAALAQNPGRPVAQAVVQQMRQSAPPPVSPVHVVNMSQVQRVQPTVGAGPQGTHQARTTPGVAALPNSQSPPNVAQRSNAVPPPSAGNRPGQPQPTNAAKPNSPWSAPVARPGAQPSNANARQQDRQQNAPPPTVAQRPNTVPPPSASNRPGQPQPTNAAKPNSPWSAPVARPQAQPSNANARQQDRQQNAPPTMAQRPNTVPPPSASNRPSQSQSTNAAKPNSPWSAPVARPQAQLSNANARQQDKQQNTAPPTVAQRPSAFPPPAANRQPIEPNIAQRSRNTAPPAATNRPSEPPPNRQQPARSERPPAAQPQAQHRPPSQPQRSQPVERAQAARRQPDAKPRPPQAESRPEKEKPPHPNN